MGMQIGEEEAPVRKLVDRRRRAIGQHRPVPLHAGDHATGLPVVKRRGHQASVHRPPLANHLRQAIQVADEDQRHAAEQTCPPAPRQAGHQRERRRERDGEEQRNRQIEGRRRCDACQLDEHGDQVLAIVVVVDVAATEPGIDRRHSTTAQDAIENGQLEGLLAAVVEVVKIGIERADARHEEKRHQERRLADRQQPPAGPEEGAQLRPPPPGHHCACHAQGQKRSLPRSSGRKAARRRWPATRRASPTQQSDDLGQAPATIPEPAERPGT